MDKKSNFDQMAYAVHSMTHELIEVDAVSRLFAELLAALQYKPDYLKVYNKLNWVFRQLLDLKTSTVTLNLVGYFAKTDYLLKEYKAPRSLAQSVNATRVRLRYRAEKSLGELEVSLYQDVKHLSEFIAFIYDEDIPASLKVLFPEEREQLAKRTLLGECVRMIVEEWDDDFVYGTADTDAEDSKVKVCYSIDNAYYPYDWTYLRRLFYEGAQLNLVRPRVTEDVIYPELIIFEPDYLIDISTVSRCFTNYAESPLVHLINKIQPAQNTEPIVLGNLAGQFLDEAIHQLPNARTYNQSVMDFFKEHAFGLLTAGISTDFHEEAKRQKSNIERAIYESLPDSLSRFNSKEGIVEPSFFSELLGMQGRMDYLQLDFKVLLEQKSGKGEFPYDGFVYPKQREEHYVQMLLYMALIRYNYRGVYEKNGRELHSFLLYSKYQHSLLGLGFAPELIFRAIKVRNGLAWLEMQLIKPDGYRILDSLTPERLNQKQVDNVLWVRFQQPQIAELLLPVQKASDLEKEYYFRFLTFIANEHMLSKLGNKTKENSGFASKWHDSLEEKRLAGNIYDKLTLVSPNAETEGGIQTVTLRFSEDDNNDMSNFRVGDIVILYTYGEGEEPDVRSTMVFRSTIEDIQTDKILLRLRAVQADTRVFKREKDKLWAIEHDFMESSYSPLYRAMHAFLSAPQPRRDLLLLQRRPEIDESRNLKGNYGDFNKLSIRVKQAKDLFLIIGPPGTGKTSFGLMTTLKEELLEPESNVLLLSYTNRAVDEICGKMLAEGIDFIRIGSELTSAPEYRDQLLKHKVKACHNVGQLKREIESTRVFVGTASSLNGSLALFQMKQFSLAIIDEASQILEPHLLGLLSAHNLGVPAIQKIVMIGDHKQLPAVVQQQPEISEVSDVRLQEIGLTDCRLSLFERLLRRYAEDERVTYMLTHQGRMHPDIASFPNISFYESRLTEVPCPHQQVKLPIKGEGKDGIRDLLTTRRVVFLAAESPEESASDKVNQVEADMIAAIVKRIYEKEKESFSVNETVGVIVPYRNQIATVRNTIDQFRIASLHDITIDTVERFQGSQRKYIIYGFTISKYYQLNFLTNNVFQDGDSLIDRKLNVAMTRAEDHLILIGNPELLENNYTFSQLINFTRGQQSFFRVEHDAFIEGKFEVPDYFSVVS